jgi:hypothetical protein
LFYIFTVINTPVTKPDNIWTRYLPQWVNACLFVIMVILNLNIEFSVNDWKNLSDSYDYLRQSKMSVLDKEFYFAHKKKDFSPRPFTVPLFYKLCDSKPDAIVRMQMVIAALSTFFLAAALMMFMEKNSAKYLLMAGVYLLAGWWNVLGWSTLVLSESLSTSLLFCWLASFLFLFKKNNATWWLVHASIALLLAFSRDSWPYVLMVFYGGFGFLWWWFKRVNFKQYLALLSLSMVVFFVQQQSAGIGRRYYLPVINSIVVRVLNKPEYVDWFVKNGMPMAAQLQKNYAGLDVVPEAGQHKLWALCGDTAYQPFLDWVIAHGQHTYTRFLITHPLFTLGMDETPAQLARIMSYNLFYIDEPRGYSAYIEPLFPLFNVGVVLVLCIMLVMIYTQRRRVILFGPVLLAAFTLMNVILSYNADALEVDRHLYSTIILVQLVGFWAVALVWDSVKWRGRSG